MSYALIIPPEYLAKLVIFRQWFKQSVRGQILEGIENYIKDIETELMKRAV